MSGHYIITGGMPDGTDSTTLTFRAFYKGATVDRAVFLTKAKSGAAGVAGAPGDPSISLSASHLSMMVMAYAEGTPVDPTFAGCDGQVTVFKGTTDITNLCTLGAVAVGCTGTVNTAANVPVVVHPMGYYRITAMPSATDTGTLTLSATYQGASYLVVINIAKAKGGYQIVATLPVTNLFIGRIVFLTTDEKLYKYTSTGWTASVKAVDVAGMFTDAQIANLSAAKLLGQLNASQILAQGQGAALNDDPQLADPTAWKPWLWGGMPTFNTSPGMPVGTNFIASPPGAQASMVGARGIPSGAGKTYRLSLWGYNSGAANGYIYARISMRDAANSEISQAMSVPLEGIIVPGDGIWRHYSGLFGPFTANAYPFMAAGVLLNYAGTVGSIYVQDVRLEEVITGDLILAGTLTATNIAAATITGDKIAARTIAAANIAANSITSNEILARTIQASDIATGTLTANEIFGGTITGDKLAAGSIITASAQINTGVILSANIGNLQVNSANIADLTVGTTKITGNAITTCVTAQAGVVMTGGIRNAYHTTCSATITTVGGPVLVQAYNDVQYNNDNSGGSDYVRTRIFRDGVIEVDSYLSPAFGYTNIGTVSSRATLLCVDTPSAGTHTYALQYLNTGTGPQSDKSFLALTELKK